MLKLSDERPLIDTLNVMTCPPLIGRKRSSHWYQWLVQHGLQVLLTLLSLLAAGVQLNYSGTMSFKRSAMIPESSGAVWMAACMLVGLSAGLHKIY